MPETTHTDKNENSNNEQQTPPIVAYLYETTTTNYPDDWTLTVKQTHPKTIRNAEFDNLQRLTRISDLQGNPDPVATIYDLGDTPKETSTHVVLNLLNEANHDRVHNAEFLAPIPEDRDKNPASPPVEKKGLAKYFADTREQETYFKVWEQENKAKKITRNETEELTMTDDIPIAQLWRQHDLGILTRVDYEETLFANPMYDHIGR